VFYLLLLCVALESRLVSRFCEDENGALIYNRVTNGYTGKMGYQGNRGYNNGNNGYNGNHRTNGEQELQRVTHAISTAAVGVGAGTEVHGGREVVILL